MNVAEMLNSFPLSSILALLSISIIGGAVRGFSGFGAGLIIMPVASAVIDPKLAVAAFLIIDFVVTLPQVSPAMRRCDWPTILPVALGALVFVPLGAFALVRSDPIAVRWGISVAIILMLGLLLSGWRYRGQPHLAASVGVGGVAGFLSGIAQIPGPPVVTYWLAGPFPATIIRANLITFFFFEAIMATGTYLANGLFTRQALILIAVLAPTYALSVWAGAQLHGKANDRAFRLVAYTLISIAALTSLPLLDNILRP